VEISLDSVATDYVRLATELAKSPLAAPLLFAAVWRARSRDLSVQTVIMALIVPYVLVRLWPHYLPVIGQQVPSFLDFGRWQRANQNALADMQRIIQNVHPNWTPPTGPSPEISAITYYAYLILLVWTPKISIKNDIIKLSVITFVVGLLSIAYGFAFEVQLSMSLVHQVLSPSQSPTSFYEDLISSEASIPTLADNVAGMVFNITCSLLLFILVIGGFAILSFWKSVLFLLFLIFAYPFVLAITRSGIADRDFIAAYLRGWSMLGQLIRYH
jgi:hypothetical protein